jgi:hypothetical protein
MANTIFKNHGKLLTTMDKPGVTFDELSQEVKTICDDLQLLTSTAGPTRCVAKLSENFDPRIGKAKEFPLYGAIKEIVDRMNRESKANLQLFQDCGNIILVSGFPSGSTVDEQRIKKIPVALSSHADEITFLRKKKSEILFPLCNAKPFEKYGIEHHKVKILGFRGVGNDREFREVGSAELYEREVESEANEQKIRKAKGLPNRNRKGETAETKNPKFAFYLQSISYEKGLEEGKKEMEGDLVIQDYDETIKNFGLDTIFHTKALDDRVGLLAHVYAMKELGKMKIPAKAIFVGDEEGVDADVSWARLARPSFRRYCREDGITILCDGYDGKNLHEFEEQRGKHLDAALISPYRSEGKGAGDPGIFSLLRDSVVNLAEEQGFEAVTTTDYVSRSLDPKIMDDFPYICSIDWSNGPVLTPIKNREHGYFNVCHVDESVSVRQILNIVGTTCWAVWFLNSKLEGF